MSAPVNLVLSRDGIQIGVVAGFADAGKRRGIVVVEGRALAVESLDGNSPAELWHAAVDGGAVYKKFADNVWVASLGPQAVSESGTYVYENIVLHGAIPMFEIKGGD